MQFISAASKSKVASRAPHQQQATTESLCGADPVLEKRLQSIWFSDAQNAFKSHGDKLATAISFAEVQGDI